MKIENNNVTGHRDGIYFEFVTNSTIQNNFSHQLIHEIKADTQIIHNAVYIVIEETDLVVDRRQGRPGNGHYGFLGLALAGLVRVVPSSTIASTPVPIIFLASYVLAYQQVPPFPPVGATNKIFYVAVAAALVTT
jgi:hypothetical protein